MGSSPTGPTKSGSTNRKHSRNVLISVGLGQRGLFYERLFDIADALEVAASELLDAAIGFITLAAAHEGLPAGAASC